MQSFIILKSDQFFSFRRRPPPPPPRMMSLFQSLSLGILLIIASLVDHASVDALKQPLILDSDYGPFIDDVFALGLLINSRDMIDMKFIIATSEQPELSAKCMAAQLKLSGVTDIPVAVGSSFPAYEERGSVCAIPGILGFAMEPECLKFSNGTTVIDNGVEYMAKMILESGIDNWWYLVVGGQSSLKALIEFYPEAAAKIDTLIVMAGNWCADFFPYPDVMAPTDETNIGCDPAAANYNLDANNIKFNHVYYVPGKKKKT
jgi:inosine-uridine nucleoside N-ribohydrolase